MKDAENKDYLLLRVSSVSSVATLFVFVTRVSFWQVVALLATWRAGRLPSVAISTSKLGSFLRSRWDLCSNGFEVTTTAAGPVAYKVFCCTTVLPSCGIRSVS